MLSPCTTRFLGRELHSYFMAPPQSRRCSSVCFSLTLLFFLSFLLNAWRSKVAEDLLSLTPVHSGSSLLGAAGEGLLLRLGSRGTQAQAALNEGVRNAPLVLVSDLERQSINQHLFIEPFATTRSPELIGQTSEVGGGWGKSASLVIKPWTDKRMNGWLGRLKKG